MAYPLVRLVSAPELDADVRFDFNDDDLTWPEHESFSLGVPSLLGDPGGVAPEYGYRTLVFNAAVKGDEALTLRKQVELARELQRDENYLMFQLSDSTPPIWYRCLRSSPGEVSFSLFKNDDNVKQWLISVSLVAEALGMGEQRTQSVTIVNDPATGGLVTVLDDVDGDAPAPLVVDMSAGTTTYTQPWLSVMPLDGDWPGGPVFWQAESFTLGTGVTTGSASDVSGGTRTSLTIPAYSSTALPVQRVLTGNVTPPFAGRWRLFARARLTPSGVVVGVDAAVTVQGAGTSCAESVSTSLGATAWRMVELGTYAFPKGNMPSARPYTLGSMQVGIDAGGQAPSAAGGLFQVDYIVAIPVDLPLDQRGFGRVTEFQTLDQTKGNVVVRLDGEHESVQEIASGAYTVASPEVPAGGFLQVTPGATNVLTVMPRRGSTTIVGLFTDLITDTTTLAVSYRPRYLWLAG